MIASLFIVGIVFVFLYLVLGLILCLVWRLQGKQKQEPTEISLPVRYYLIFCYTIETST
jgi:tryptophan-rich sensory protein